MLDFALGELHLLPADFWHLTWCEYLRRARGHHRQQEAEWRRTRWLATHLLNIQLAAADRLRPEELLPLPSDPPPPPVEVMSDADYERIRLLDSDLNILN